MRPTVCVALGGAGPCRAYMVDMKLRTAGDRIYYPDVVTVCAPLPDDALVVTEPCLVVEVTSRSTRRVDRTEKLDAYLRCPSLLAYLIVEQAARSVDRWWRDGAGGEWRRDTITDATGGRVPVPCPATELTLDDIYRGVTLGDEG